MINSREFTSYNWERQGLLFEPDEKLSWSKSHAMIPTPQAKEDGHRIYYSARNNRNQSSIGWFDLKFSESAQIYGKSLRPILEPGELGCFDDNGVSPSCIIELESGDLALYYIGWNPGSTTRVNLFGGLAISKDSGRTFSRWSKAPILERTKCDPLINTAPWVVKSTDGYRMYYVSGVSWADKDSPRYNIKIAYSQDGISWERTGRVVLDFESDKETALARPYVILENGVWKMWVARRIGEYSIAYAESADGITWERMDSVGGLNPSEAHEENIMTEYGVVIQSKNARWMLYNGNNYGQAGILLAKSKK